MKNPKQRNDDHFPSPAFNFARADNGVHGVVAALYDHVRTQRAHELEGRVLLEEHDEIHCLQCGQHVRSLGLIAHRTTGPLESGDGFISVDADDQCITA